MFDIIRKLMKNNLAMKVRTVFMGTPQFAVTMLGSLLQSSCQVLAVYTQPDKPAGRGRPVVFPPVKAGPGATNTSYSNRDFEVKRGGGEASQLSARANNCGSLRCYSSPRGAFLAQICLS